MSKESQLIKAFASNDLVKVGQLTAEAKCTASIEPEITAMQKVVSAPEFQESVEDLLSMDREIKVIQIYRVLTNAIAAIRAIHQNLPNVPDQWSHFFESKTQLLNEIVNLVKEARPRFVGNIHHIQAIFENEIDKLELKLIEVVRAIDKPAVEISQDQE